MGMPPFQSPATSRTYRWLDQEHEIRCPELSDREVASRVRMLMRGDLDHELVCLMARDRIMALSQENAELRAEIEQLKAAEYRKGYERFAWADVLYGDWVWIDNCEDGKYPEADPKISGPFRRVEGNGCGRCLETRDGRVFMHYPENLLRKVQ